MASEVTLEHTLNLSVVLRVRQATATERPTLRVFGVVRGRDGPGGWVLLPEPELRLGDRPDLAEPDVAGWRRERLPEAPPGAITVVPDWVCEVLSNSTRRHDLTVKMPMYFRHGVGHAWLVDADTRTLQVYRRVTDGWLLALSASGDDVVRAVPFDAIELDLSLLWRW